jgi:peptide/nickel transport system substrate-binding protein
MQNKHFRRVCLIFLMLWSIGASGPVRAEPAVSTLTTGPSLPRTETLYFNGQQWGSVGGWNPYSTNNNNSMAIAQQDNARVTVFETPYIYNMLDGQVYPLVADGAFTWNGAHTEITFKIKTAAHWSDGAPVTANDVAYTWASHVKYGTQIGNDYQNYIDTIEAVDAHTVRVKAKLDGGGKAVNPLMVSAYLSSNYVIQKAWTQKLEARTGSDADAFKADLADDVVYSGPYHKYFVDDSEVVLVRDDNYWGKDASMWGKLPTPKYLAHIIYADNAAGIAAFKAGEVDVSQQFNANVQDWWLVDHLPISTYYPDAPYNIGASLPTAFYNLDSYGLDQVAVRKAIAMAVDYDTIVANAMTNQSPTFVQAPRSLMNPTPNEQAVYNHATVASLQWAGNDIAGAKTLLDAANIKDTNADGWREYNGQKLSYVATCPNGWIDWQAAIEVLAAVGTEIGIEITTNYPEWSDYQTVVTNSDTPLPAGYDIFMMWTDGAGPTQPWSRIRHLISSEFIGQASNWNGNWGRYSNPAVDTLIQAIPAETDPTQLKADYTELTRIYLTDVPSFALMYRPQAFHTVNESVWTGFPKSGDGTNPPVPPLDLTDGYSIAGLYNLDRYPTITSINRLDASPTSAESVQFTTTFSETVTGVDTSDFNLTTIGITGATITGVSGSGTTYTVTVNTGSSNGTIRLDVVDDNTIVDAASNSLGGVNTGDGSYTSGETYTIIKDTSFSDLNNSYWAWQYVERLYNAGITGGCSTSPLIYCPEDQVTRAQMAVFLEKGMAFPASFNPPNAAPTFTDTVGHWAEDWIEALKNDGVTSGCATGLYCPEDPVTRAQMAVFLLKAKHGTSYTPPAATGVFTDVPVGYWADKWIEQLATEGITGGCATGLYCPDDPVTRAQMAVFLVKTFNLP